MTRTATTQTRRLVLTQHGRPSDVVSLTQWQLPDEPETETARVRMLAAPIHPSDSLMIMGRYGHRVAPGAVLGSEGIGVIDTVGSGCELEVGQRVVVKPTYRYGTWTTVLDINESDVVTVPDQVPTDQAAFAGVNPLTALGLLQGVSSGDWVLQNAANSASARNVASVANQRNINVINIVRRPEAANVFRRDEHVIIDTGSSFIEKVKAITGGAPVNVGIDVQGGSAANRMIECIADQGRMRVYGAVSSEPLQAWAPNLIFCGITIEGFWLLPWLQQQGTETIRKNYATVFELLAAGVLNTDVGHRFTLTEHIDALRLATTPERVGKVIFDLTNE
jgi:NADPH:quinone reductase-like Zn-dependent oxidoreductase